MKLVPALLASVAMAPALATTGVAEMTAEPTAVIQGLDKITARVSRFDAQVGQQAAFGALSVIVRDCEKSAPEDRTENAAFVEIYEAKPGDAETPPPPAPSPSGASPPAK